MEPYLFSILLADLATELRTRYNAEHERLIADESNNRSIDEKVAKKKLDEAESIDEVDFRKK